MLRNLILKELQNHLLSKRFVFSFCIVFGIMLGSTAVLMRDYRESVLDYQANEAATRQLLKDAGYWWGLQWEGVRVVRPISPLRILVTGAEGQQDPVARLFDKGKPYIRFFGSMDRNPLSAMLPAVDITFIVGVVLSLITLVLTFDAISGEREEGTLKLLLSFPVPRSTLIFAKWAGGFVTLSLPFIAGFLAVAIWLKLSPAIHLGSREWMGLLGIAAASLLYLAWIFSASLVVSCWCRRSATAMSVLLFCWVVVVLIVPNIAPYVAEGMVPVASQQSVRFQGMSAVKELQMKEEAALRDLEKKYDTQRWWRHEKAWLEGIDIITEGHNVQRKATQAIEDTRAARVQKQTLVARGISRISPLSSYAHIVTTLAWTGVDATRHLVGTMRQYEDRIREIVSSGMRENEPYVPEKIPYFNYTPPDLGTRFAATIMDWLSLLAGTVVFFLLAFVSFVTRDVV